MFEPARRRLLQRSFAAAGLLPFTALVAFAQRRDWPPRPINLVVAYPPGGVSDNIARALAERVALQLGTPVVVNNRGGAGGVVAMEMLARARADGTTLVFCAISPLVVAPQLGPVGFDPEKDIAPVVSVMVTPVLVLGTPALAGDTFSDMLAMAKSDGAGIRWATSGVATIGHVVLEQVRIASGAQITHVPYKGGGQQLTDALSGQFEVLSSNVGAQQLDHVRNGRLKALAVGSPSRLAVLPNVPTLAELGFPESNLASVFGVFAPGRTPEAIVLRLNEAFNKALRHPDIRRRLESVNNLVTGGTAADFHRRIAQERASSRGIVRNARP